MNIHPSLIPAFCATACMVGTFTKRCCPTVARSRLHGILSINTTTGRSIRSGAPARHDDTPESLAARVFAEECAAYPEALRLYAAGRLKIEGRRVCVARE